MIGSRFDFEEVVRRTLGRIGENLCSVNKRNLFGSLADKPDIRTYDNQEIVFTMQKTREKVCSCGKLDRSGYRLAIVKYRLQIIGGNEGDDL